MGVALGCLLGMSSLLWMDLDKAERLKRQRELRTLYTTLMEEGHHTIGAQHCSLFLLDQARPYEEDVGIRHPRDPPLTLAAPHPPPATLPFAQPSLRALPAPTGERAWRDGEANAHMDMILIAYISSSCC